MGLRGIEWVELAFPDVNIARARNNLVFSWKLSGLCRSSAPLLPTNSGDEPS